MKVRLIDNSIRLRLRKSEIASLTNNEAISTCLRFIDSAQQHIQYRLTTGTQWLLHLDNNTLHITMPTQIAQQFSNSDMVSCEGVHGSINLLIEKDFTCLIPRPNENPNDYYPNPKQRS